MERQSLELFFALSGGAVVLLFLTVLWQRAQLHRADQEIETASKTLARNAATQTSFVLPLIEEAPFPICYANGKGGIQTASRSFYGLAGKKIETLAAFAQATGARLEANSTKTRHERIVVRGPHDANLRHFSLVTWPVQGRHEVLGTVYTLLEHTSTVRHNSDQHSFNQELVTLQEELLHALAKGPDEAILQELGDLTTFLKQSYTARPQRTLEQFDLVQVVHEALEEYRPHFRKHHIAITSTLPKKLRTSGFATESLEIVRLLLAGVVEHAHPHSTVRLHVEKQGMRSVLVITLPEYKHTTGPLDEAFAFGKSADKRASKIRFALARLMMGHQHGSLHLTEDGDGQVVAELLFGTGA